MLKIDGYHIHDNGTPMYYVNVTDAGSMLARVTTTATLDLEDLSHEWSDSLHS